MAKVLAVALAALSALAHVSAVGSPTFPSLISRQAGFDPSSIPPQCTSTCSPILTTIGTCQELSCLCTNGVAQQIATCIDCFAGVGGPSVVLSGQSIVDEFTNACATNGESVSSFKVSAVAPTGANTGTGSSVSLPTGLSSAAGGSTGSRLPPVITPASSGASSAASAGSTGGSSGSTNGAGVARVGLSGALLGGAAFVLGLF